MRVAFTAVCAIDGHPALATTLNSKVYISLSAIWAETHLIGAIKYGTSLFWKAISEYTTLVSMIGVPALVYADPRPNSVGNAVGRGRRVAAAWLSSHRVAGNRWRMRLVYGSHHVCAVSTSVLIQTPVPY